MTPWEWEERYGSAKTFCGGRKQNHKLFQGLIGCPTPPPVSEGVPDPCPPPPRLPRQMCVPLPAGVCGAWRTSPIIPPPPAAAQVYQAAPPEQPRPVVGRQFAGPHRGRPSPQWLWLAPPRPLQRVVPLSVDSMWGWLAHWSGDSVLLQ